MAPNGPVALEAGLRQVRGGGKEVPMRSVICLIGILVGTVWIPAAWSDIYVWVDKDGLRHVSNLNPPAHAEVLLHTEGPSPDDAAGSVPLEQQRRQDMKDRETVIREREARLAQREAELERRIAAVEQKSQAALDQTAEALAAVAARDTHGAKERRCVLPTIIYRHGLYGYRTHRHRGARQAHRGDALSFERHPFHLGAIRLPLGPIGVAPRRYQPAGGRKH